MARGVFTAHKAYDGRIIPQNNAILSATHCRNARAITAASCVDRRGSAAAGQEEWPPVRNTGSREGQGQLTLALSRHCAASGRSWRLQRSAPLCSTYPRDPIHSFSAPPRSSRRLGERQRVRRAIAAPQAVKARRNERDDGHLPWAELPRPKGPEARGRADQHAGKRASHDCSVRGE